ncbi:nucleotide pyrophosphohydrolase [Candidatus Saccharibacteria bacterium]|nr:nucleotide pyrophosphohydrolase [Candidatus Saccharibacteria bacterium]
MSNNIDLKKKLSALNKESSLRDLQAYVHDMVQARGFDKDENLSKKMLLITEEVGELAQAIRKREGLSIDMNADYNTNTENEMADVLILLLGLANLCDIDLTDAFIAKEELNQKRTWGKP